MADQPSRPGHFAVPIQWQVHEHTPTYYATNIVAQLTEHEFVISFFELFPPLIVGTSEEIEEQAVAIQRVTADCLARVVIAANRMPGFVQALQGILDQYNARNEASEE